MFWFDIGSKKHGEKKFRGKKNLRTNILQKSISIWLDVDIKNLNERVKRNKKRPLLKTDDVKKKMKELYDGRKNIYKLANHKITCDKLDKQNIAEKIVKLYEKY